MPVKLRSQVRADFACKNVGIGIVAKRHLHQKNSSLKMFVCWKFCWRCSHSLTCACLKAVLSPSLQRWEGVLAADESQP